MPGPLFGVSGSPCSSTIYRFVFVRSLFLVGPTEFLGPRSASGDRKLTPELQSSDSEFAKTLPVATVVGPIVAAQVAPVRPISKRVASLMASELPERAKTGM